MLIAIPVISFAQPSVREEQGSVRVYFRVGATIIDESYKNNGKSLSRFAEIINSCKGDKSARVGRISIVSSTSPEGGKALNDRLAEGRAKAITDWLKAKTSADLVYNVETMRTDWDMLISFVENNDDVPNKQEVLNILRNTPELIERDGKLVDYRLEELKALKNSESYNWLLEKIFPNMRYAAALTTIQWELPRVLTITISSPMKFPYTGGSDVVKFERSIKDDIAPTATCEADWIHSINASISGVDFVVAENPNYESRSTAIKLAYGYDTYLVEVNQEAAPVPAPVPVVAEPEVKPEVVNEPVPAPVVEPEVKPEVVNEPAPVVEPVVKPEVVNEPVPMVEPEVKPEVVSEPTPAPVTEPVATKSKKPFYMAIKTNMIYDLVAVPNISAEFYLGKGFSLSAGYTHAWWKNEAKNWFWRYYGAEASLRWWFGKRSRIKPLQGHHIGVNYQMMTYDFQLGNQGVLAGKPGGTLIDRPSHTVALEYGYSVAIARRLNLDFVVGAGYNWGIFDEYIPIDGHYVWQSTKRRQYIGPTKLEVSLVGLIGHGNYNRNKGKEAKR